LSFQIDLALSQETGGIAGVDGLGRQGLHRHRAGAEDGAVADDYAGADEGAGGDPGPAADIDGFDHQLKIVVIDVVGAGAELGVLGNQGVGGQGDLGHAVAVHAGGEGSVFRHFEVARIPDADARIDLGRAGEARAEQRGQPAAPGEGRGRGPFAEEAPGQAPDQAFEAMAQGETGAAFHGIGFAIVENGHGGAEIRG